MKIVKNIDLDELISKMKEDIIDSDFCLYNAMNALDILEYIKEKDIENNTDLNNFQNINYYYVLNDCGFNVKKGKPIEYYELVCNTINDLIGISKINLINKEIKNIDEMLCVNGESVDLSECEKCKCSNICLFAKRNHKNAEGSANE